MNIQVMFTSHELPRLFEAFTSSECVLQGTEIVVDDLPVASLHFSSNNNAVVEIDEPFGPGNSALELVLETKKLLEDCNR